MDLASLQREDIFALSAEDIAELEAAIFGEVYEPLNKYCPHRPWPKQRAFLDCTAKEVFFGGSVGPGKALHVDTKIPTPGGFVRIGDIRPGATVFGRDGQQVTVEFVSTVMHHECYRMTFDDGSVVIADRDHRWLTFSNSELSSLTRHSDAWRKARRKRRPSRATRSDRRSVLLAERNRRQPPPSKSAPTGTVRTTQELFETSTDRRGHTNHAIPVCQPVECESLELPIDPYCLGAWLGDGTSRRAAITLHDDDVQIRDQFELAGWKITKESHQTWVIGEVVEAFRHNGARGRVSTWMREIRKLGLEANKHVPSQYLWSSKDDRLALLQGLMDTDGTTGSGQCTFTNMNEQLAASVATLVRSFGWKTRVRSKPAKLYGRVVGTAYDVSFCPSEIVFRLTRKAEKQTIASRRTNKFRYLKSIEPCGVHPVQCIKVSSEDSLFLCSESFIPTHNTDVLLMSALQWVHVPKYSCLILRRDFQRLKLPGSIMDRARQWLSNSDAKWNGSDKTFTFPSGATIQFGYIDNPTDRFRYASSEFQQIIWDEVTEMLLNEDDSNPYLFLFSRLRKTSDNPVPLQMRLASNPGNIGHAFIKRRFITPEATEFIMSNSEEVKIFYADTEQQRAFLPGVLRDNPAINPDDYLPSLAHLPRVTQERLLRGDWSIREDSLIQPHLWLRYRVSPAGQITIVNSRGEDVATWHESESYRFTTIDPAGTSQDRAKASRGREHSWSVAGTFDKAPTTAGKYVAVRDIWRKRVGFNELVDGIRQINSEWTPARIRVENEKYGMAAIEVLGAEMTIDSVPTEGKDKVTRATPLLQALDRGEFALPYDAPWLEVYESECFTWTGHPDEVSDQVDVTAYAAIEASGRGFGLWAPELFGPRIWLDQFPLMAYIMTAVIPRDASDIGQGLQGAIVSVGINGDGLFYCEVLCEDSAPSTLLTKAVVTEEGFSGQTATSVVVPNELTEMAQLLSASIWASRSSSPDILAIDLSHARFTDPTNLTHVITTQKLRFRRGCRGSQTLLNRAKSFPHTNDVAPLVALGAALEAMAILDRD